ncbi:MAG TPA: ATP-dependent Clp protease ATP-binding subunit, partial [Planctomycetes bacterium]|nr:ATP-dependent Clp protease ATP-binding subunit [Planctomycetota bacterium]
IDFKNVILIMTSNVGANLIRSSGGLGFVQKTEEQTYEKMKEMLMSEVERHFRPEFLNRVDEIIVFNSLTKEDLSKIIHIEMRKVKERLAERGVDMVLTDEAVELLIERGHHMEYGARPLRRAIERNIEDPLAEEILKGTFKEGEVIEAYVEDGTIKFRKAEKKDPVETGSKDS